MIVLMVITFIAEVFAPLSLPMAFPQALEQLGARPRRLVSFTVVLLPCLYTLTRYTRINIINMHSLRYMGKGESSGVWIGVKSHVMMMVISPPT